jgi:hypothetical protein
MLLWDNLFCLPIGQPLAGIGGAGSNGIAADTSGNTCDGNAPRGTREAGKKTLTRMASA